MERYHLGKEAMPCEVFQLWVSVRIRASELVSKEGLHRGVLEKGHVEVPADVIISLVVTLAKGRNLQVQGTPILRGLARIGTICQSGIPREGLEGQADSCRDEM
jgi:hypothetical protein